jgi:2-oxoisovalerate dehydrogenase E1 component
VKRYPAYDPPEYVNWTPEPDAMQGFTATMAQDPARAARLERVTLEKLLALYAGMLRFRLHDIALQRWVRQGVISKAWLGTGEEAVTVGNVHALREGDLVGPMIRNAGACHEMGMPLADMFRAYLGTADQLTRGRDLHTGDPARGVVPPISFVASLVPVMAGMALAARLRGEQRVALTWVGDGATRTGEFHEGFNFAAAQRVPLIVIIQDNGIALGTPRSTHTRGDFADLGKAYGMPSVACDGNHVLDVLAATEEAVEICRQGEGPVLVVAETFRMGGHATHDEAEARAIFSPELFTRWGRRDPIGMYETWLAERRPPLDPSRTNRAVLEEIEASVTREVEAGAQEALDSRRDSMPDGRSLREGVFATGDDSIEPAFPPCPVSATGAAAHR